VIQRRREIGEEAEQRQRLRPASHGRLLVAMDGGGREGGQADGDVLRAIGSGRAVADPFARRGDDRLPGTSRTPASCSTRTMPRSTTVISSNAGRCPGSSQPDGEVIRAMLTSAWPELTRPANSSIFFGLVPAAATTAGAAMRRGISHAV